MHKVMHLRVRKRKYCLGHWNLQEGLRAPSFQEYDVDVPCLVRTFEVYQKMETIRHQQVNVFFSSTGALFVFIITSAIPNHAFEGACLLENLTWLSLFSLYHGDKRLFNVYQSVLLFFCGVPAIYIAALMMRYAKRQTDFSFKAFS